MKNALLLLLLLVIGFLGFVATRPDTYHVERSATVAAPPATVYSVVSDFHRWGEWSPWEHLDPNMAKTITGPESGVGANYHWAGNDKAGEGNMLITEATPGERLAIKLDFIKPFASTSTTVFAFAPEGEGTRVTWSMDGRMGFIEKGMCVFMSMDKMIGGDFEKGLASLGKVAAAEPPAAAAPAESAAAAGK